MFNLTLQSISGRGEKPRWVGERESSSPIQSILERNWIKIQERKTKQNVPKILHHTNSESGTWDQRRLGKDDSDIVHILLELWVSTG